MQESLNNILTDLKNLEVYLRGGAEMKSLHETVHDERFADMIHKIIVKYESNIS